MAELKFSGWWKSLPRGKPWTVEEEQRLKQMFASGIRDYRALAAGFDGKYSANAVYQKLLDLGLLSKEEEKRRRASSSLNVKLDLPDDLPSVEEQLKVLAAALRALQTPMLDKTEVMRLANIIRGVEVYIARFADYVDYRGLERELEEWKAKYAALAKKVEGV
ncbi:MAG: hypothetical protein QXL10_02520 [Candidatus Bathyarchaeia archaeon]